MSFLNPPSPSLRLCLCLPVFVCPTLRCLSTSSVSPSARRCCVCPLHLSLSLPRLVCRSAASVSPSAPSVVSVAVFPSTAPLSHPRLILLLASSCLAVCLLVSSPAFQLPRLSLSPFVSPVVSVATSPRVPCPVLWLSRVCALLPVYSLSVCLRLSVSSPACPVSPCLFLSLAGVSLSLSLSLSLSVVLLSPAPTVCLCSLSLSLHLAPCVCSCLSLSVSLSVSAPFSPSLRMSLALCLPAVCRSLSPHLAPSACLAPLVVWLSVSIAVCLLLCLSPTVSSHASLAASVSISLSVPWSPRLSPTVPVSLTHCVVSHLVSLCSVCLSVLLSVSAVSLVLWHACISHRVPVCLRLSVSESVSLPVCLPAASPSQSRGHACVCAGRLALSARRLLSRCPPCCALSPALPVCTRSFFTLSVWGSSSRSTSPPPPPPTLSAAGVPHLHSFLHTQYCVPPIAAPPLAANHPAPSRMMLAWPPTGAGGRCWGRPLPTAARACTARTAPTPASTRPTRRRWWWPTSPTTLRSTCTWRPLSTQAA